MNRLSQYTSDLGFWQRHFQVIDGPIEWRAMDARLARDGCAGFWLDSPKRTLAAIVTIIRIDSDMVRVAAWFFEKYADSADWNDYFIGVPNYGCVQVWPHENERLQKVLTDAIAMETLGGRSPVLRAY